MNFRLEELAQVLEQSLQTKKIGVPVSVRVRVISSAESSQVFPEVMELLSGIWNWARFSLRAVQHPTEIQTDIQIHLQSGPTISVSLIRTADRESRFKLLLVGNHGVIRLEGEEGIQFEAINTGPKAQYWNKLLKESLSQEHAVQSAGTENGA